MTAAGRAGRAASRLCRSTYRFAWAMAAAGWTGPAAAYAGMYCGLSAGQRWVGYAVGGGLTALSAAGGVWLSGRVRSRRACVRAALAGLAVAVAGWPWAAEVWADRNGLSWFEPIDERCFGLGRAGLCWGGAYLILAGAWGRWVLHAAPPPPDPPSDPPSDPPPSDPPSSGAATRGPLNAGGADGGVGPS